MISSQITGEAADIYFRQAANPLDVSGICRRILPGNNSITGRPGGRDWSKVIGVPRLLVTHDFADGEIIDQCGGGSPSPSSAQQPYFLRNLINPLGQKRARRSFSVGATLERLRPVIRAAHVVLAVDDVVALEDSVV